MKVWQPSVKSYSYRFSFIYMTLTPVTEASDGQTAVTGGLDKS